MSPYHHLTTFENISPRPINATDKTMFHVTRIGNMHISIPNGIKTHVMLKGVWYCEKLTFMLISISRCNKASYSVTFKDQKCTIRDPQGTFVSWIPISDNLYKIQCS